MNHYKHHFREIKSYIAEFVIFHVKYTQVNVMCHCAIKTMFFISEIQVNDVAGTSNNTA